MADYANPEVLVTTDWVAAHKDDPGIRLVEVDVDSQAYAAGHIPGAIGFNWQTQLQDQVSRDILSKAGLEKLLGDAGISQSDTIVLYGDNHNWFAAYAFWLFKIYGHEKVLLMDGGRNKWLNEDDKALTADATATKPVTYTAKDADLTLRAKVPEVLTVVNAGTHNLVDVRSPDEFTGKVIAPPGMSETAQRGGHIPGARSIPWSKAVNEDSTFKSADELSKIYTTDAGVQPGKDTIAYCRIGERSSHTWFVLKYLLGIKNVKNYDGSWTEYGSMVGVPIEHVCAQVACPGFGGSRIGVSLIREALCTTDHRPWAMPRRPWAMAMTWRDLLFAHWEVPVEKLRVALPGALPLDLFEGRAFVGVVPFRMTGIRGRFMPPIPGQTAFGELNVRTYVSINNKPGVYFFSLDATNPLAIATARATFSLNYLRARIETARVGDTVTYSCERTDRRAPAASLRCAYTATGPEFKAEPGTLEHWLTERYALYSVSRMGRGRTVRMGEIHHKPWPLRPATATIENLDMTRLLGFGLEGPPCSVLMADRIDVPAWLPVRV